MDDKRVLVVVGADRFTGIAGMTAQSAASRGWIVVLVGRKVGVHKLAEHIRVNGGVASSHQVDGGDRDAMIKVVAATMKAFGRIDSLINAAAFAPGDDKDLDVLDPDALEATWGPCLRPAIVSAQEVVKVMRAQQFGRIVFVGTANSYNGG